MLSYHNRVLKQYYSPSNKFLYLKTNVDEGGLDINKPLNEKIKNMSEAINPEPFKWVESITPDIKNIKHQSHRNIELHRQFLPNQVSYSQIKRIIGDEKIYKTRGSMEDKLIKTIRDIDDEIVLVASFDKDI